MIYVCEIPFGVLGPVGCGYNGPTKDWETEDKDLVEKKTFAVNMTLAGTDAQKLGLLYKPNRASQVTTHEQDEGLKEYATELARSQNIDKQPIQKGNYAFLKDGTEARPYTSN